MKAEITKRINNVEEIKVGDLLTHSNSPFSVYLVIERTEAKNKVVVLCSPSLHTIGSTVCTTSLTNYKLFQGEIKLTQ